MTTQEWAYVQRLQRRASNVAPDLAQAELRAYYLIRQALTDAEAARAIQSGTMDRLIAEILDDKAGGPFAALRGRLDRATIDAAESEAGLLPNRYNVGVFDRMSPHVVTAVRTLSARTIDTLKTETQDMVRQQVRLGIEAGKNPRVIARELKELIGLAPNQARAVQNFRHQLETGDRAALDRMLGRGVLRQPDGEVIRRGAHAGGEGLSGKDLGLLDRRLGTDPLTPEQIARMTTAYEKRMLAWNAESHARTMALDANKRASVLAWEDAVDKGIIDRSALRKVWVTVGDDRVRPEHEALNGTEVGFDEAFPNGEQVPGSESWNCRCVARVVVTARAA